MTPQSPDRAAHAARSIRRTLILPFLIAALTAADGSAQRGHVVSGTVRTADGRPIAGATIRVSGATGAARGTTVKTQTDANGNYRVQVPPGHYDVDGFADLEFEGQTYRELWLDRTNTGCERQLSEKGIVRHFVLRLSGLAKCTANLDPTQPESYYGGQIIVSRGGVPDDAVVRFTLTPVGPLADGTAGTTLTFERTGAMLDRGRGVLGQTAWLHDIPLGRYRVSAEASRPGGARQPLSLRNEASAPAAAVEVSFRAARMFPYGVQSAELYIVPGGANAQPAPAPPPDRGAAPAPSPAAQAGGLPAGTYHCTYASQYAGPMPTGRSIEIVDGGRYVAWGGAGEYAAGGSSVQWRSGPLSAQGVAVTFSAPDGRPTLTVRGGPAAADPDGTNQCVRS